MDWIGKIIAAEEKCHQAFFGQTQNLALMRQVLEATGQERVKAWNALGLEVHFLPKLVLTAKTSLKGWKKKPEFWFWEQIGAGNIKRRNASGELASMTEVGLEGIVALVDTRCKPSYDGGRQMFANDANFLGKLIARLRADGKLVKYEYGPQESRFGVSPVEWDNHLRSVVAELLGLPAQRMRLETIIEANIVPQAYPAMCPRANDGQTDTWVWYEEFFGDASNRLVGGDSNYGGLVRVSYNFADGRWRRAAVRPLGVLAS
ncbi:MAG: hypothetical protein AAB360_00710 [Patescibacteria group bacterium]